MPAPILAPILAATLILAAPQARPHQEIGPSDYPGWALRAKASAGAFVALLIAPNGKPAACRSDQNYGDARLAAQICSIEMRKRWVPARGPDSRAAYGYVERLDRLWLPGTGQGFEIASLSRSTATRLRFSAMPAGVAAGTARVALEVNAAAAITDCGAADASAPAELVRLICVNRIHLIVKPLTDAKGAPVAYVTALDVEAAAAGAPTMIRVGN